MNATIGASEKPNPKYMKTLLLTALTFTGLALVTPEAQARDHRSHGRGYDSYRSSRSYGYGHYRSDCAPRYYSRRAYYSSAPRYYYRPSYYRPSSRYDYTDRCEPRRSFRSPLISFVFGF